MNEIPPIYWMIVIGAIALMVCVVLFYIAMVLLESKKAIVESRKIMEDAGKTLRQVDLIVNDLQSSMASVRGAVEEINQSILVPIRKLGYGVSAITGFLGGLLGRKREEE